jgi:hypothetical protein
MYNIGLLIGLRHKFSSILLLLNSTNLTFTYAALSYPVVQ